MNRIMVIVLVIAILMFLGYSPCRSEYEEAEYHYQKEILLKISGYGYEMADIVLVDTEKAPEIGDIVLYDASINRSYCMAFGPGVGLTKIIGQWGDKVKFTDNSYEANGYTVSLERKYESRGIIYKQPRNTKKVMWGKDIYEDVANMELNVPNKEYLADKIVGYECPPGQYDEHGSSLTYRRFTIKREAIKGIILRKVGHDDEFERKWKNVVY